MEIFDIVAQRPVTPVLTKGVESLMLESTVLIRMYMLAIKRWLVNVDDNFTLLTPHGINVEVSNGDVVIEKLLITDFTGLKDSLYVIVDDYEDDRLVITVLLPDEYLKGGKT